MHAPPTRRPRRAAGVAAALSITLLGACATMGGVLGGYRDAHRSAAGRDEGWLRSALERGSYDSALARLTTGPDAPADALLRALYAGAVAHYGANHAASARALGEANALAEDRYTKSVSRAGVSLLTSDVTLPYAAGRTERLLVHYYGVLGYLRQDSTAAAAVEARRLSKLLLQYGEGRSAEEAATHAMLHYVAGVAFEAAGERTDAVVSYRNAAALAGDSVLARATERRAAARPSGRWRPAPRVGEVVVVLEQGFIGRRAEQTGTVGFDSSEVVRLATGDSSATVVVARRFPSHARRADEAPPPLAEAGAVLAHATRRPRGTPPAPMDARPAAPVHPATIAAAPPGYYLRIAWPAFVREPRAVAPIGVVVAGAARPAVALRYRADLSDAAERDFERQRAAIIARAASRAAAKYWATRAAAKKGGAVGGAVANAATALLERADTRSWHLLPGTVSVARFTLPPGVHELAVEFPATAGGPPVRIPLGQVTVAADRVSTLSKRLWSNGPAVAGEYRGVI